MMLVPQMASIHEIRPMDLILCLFHMSEVVLFGRFWKTALTGSSGTTRCVTRLGTPFLPYVTSG